MYFVFPSEDVALVEFMYPVFPSEDVPLVEFMYLVFPSEDVPPRPPLESYHPQQMS